MLTSSARLMEVFPFGPEELTANRQGFLTARQQAEIAERIRVARSSSYIAMLVIFASVSIVFGIPLIAAQDPALTQARPFLAGTAIAVLVVFAVFTIIGLRRLQPLQRQEIRVLKGTIHLTTRQFRHGRWTGYYLSIGGTRFQLTSEQQFKMLIDGGEYRIYYIHYPPVHVILSMEQTE